MFEGLTMSWKTQNIFCKHVGRVCESFDRVWQGTSKDFDIICEMFPGKPQPPVRAAEQLSEYLSFTVCIHHIVWSVGVSRGGAHSLFFFCFADSLEGGGKKRTSGLQTVLFLVVCFCLFLLSASTMHKCQTECQASLTEAKWKQTSYLLELSQPQWVISAQILHYTI